MIFLLHKYISKGWTSRQASPPANSSRAMSAMDGGRGGTGSKHHNIDLTSAGREFLLTAVSDSFDSLDPGKRDRLTGVKGVGHG